MEILDKLRKEYFDVCVSLHMNRKAQKVRYIGKSSKVAKMIEKDEIRKKQLEEALGLSDKVVLEEGVFVFENINPSGKKRGDCVVRSIAKALDKSWEVVYMDLVDISKMVYAMPDSKEVYEIYLKDFENIDVFKVVEGKKKRLTVNDVCKLDGTFIIRIAGHMTVVKKNRIYDLWDCGKKSIYKIWKVS